jgi:pathogenesis-related protein 1
MNKVSATTVIAAAFLVGSVSTAVPAHADGFDPGQVLSEANASRADYGAPPLAWNASLLPDTQQWANNCRFVHSSGSYGENLFVQGWSFNNPPTFRDAQDSWMGEAPGYDYNLPGFSVTTGHFTRPCGRAPRGSRQQSAHAHRTVSIPCGVAPNGWWWRDTVRQETTADRNNTRKMWTGTADPLPIWPKY